MRDTLKEWGKKRYTADSLPSPKTLRAMAKRGDIPGAFQTRANRWYVEVNSSVTASSIEDQVAKVVGNDPVVMTAIQ